ncbi:unnamed protein product [Arctogadus glacialis]
MEDRPPFSGGNQYYKLSGLMDTQTVERLGEEKKNEEEKKNHGVCFGNVNVFFFTLFFLFFFKSIVVFSFNAREPFACRMVGLCVFIQRDTVNVCTYVSSSFHFVSLYAQYKVDDSSNCSIAVCA